MASEEYKESEISKIVKRLMDEEGFEFGEAVREAMEQTKNFESKADGGSIGIEVLFGPKRENFIYGGTVFPDGRRGFGGGADMGTVSGTTKGSSANKGLSGGYQGGPKGGYGNTNNNDGPKGPPVTFSKDNTPEPITFNKVTGKKMLPTDLAIQKQFLNLVKKKGYESGLDTEADDLYNAYRTATGLDNFNQNVLVDSTTNILDKEKDGILKTFVDKNTTIKDLDTGKSTKNLLVETPTGLIQRTVRPSGIMENDIAQTFGAPQSLSVDPYYKFAEGGRVGLFMGGPALEGEALNIYNSMNTYGATDQEIADRLTSLGLYDSNASTPDPTPDPGQGNTIGYQGGDNSPVSLFGKNLTSTFTRPPGSEPKISKDAFFGLGKFFQGKEKGTLGDRRLKAYNNPMLPSFVGALGKKMSPFNPNSKNYNPNMASQLNFLEMGTIGDETGLSLVGYDPGSGLMKYGSDSVLAGKNVISGFGTNDYEKMLMDYIGKMSVNKKISDAGRIAKINKAKLELAALTGQNAADINADTITTQLQIADTNNISTQEAAGVMAAIEKDNKGDQGTSSAGGFSNVSSNAKGPGGAYNEGNYCFDPSTLIQMADGSTKEIKNIQLGDDTKGGEVTGVFQFKATDEIHDYKGVTVAGSHYVKEDGKFIMVKDSPLSVKIDKIPVVYSLDTTGRRIFINDIEFADYNGDGVAKNFLTNAGVDLTGFDTEVLRQVENRLI